MTIPSQVRQRRPLTPTLRGGGGNPSTTATTSTSLAAVPPLLSSNPFWASQQLTLGINALGLVISLVTQSHVHLDLLGTGAFAVSVLPAAPVANASGRLAISCGMVALWSVKLAGFLFFRATRVHTDGRLTTTLSTVSGTVGFWVISAIWGVVTALPHSLTTTSTTAVVPTLNSTPVTNLVGLVLFSAGWLLETTADLQKWNFKQTAPSGSFCNVGVWNWSQHPNWCGNFLLWMGILVWNLPSLMTVEPVEKIAWWSTLWSYRKVALACLSPLLLGTLFYGQATGSITDSVSMANEKYGYGTDPVYTEYINSTPLFFPRWFGTK
eukprot:CAMPEP_0172441208 /NCGR_PEP_ID=MMETSP1065-20121228/1777_1 /TAXON_ID=265537 /ORGANISM="Amphiprora paludosa, Strain CCMP125" /LENGTH=323 /DNA_ID=CAMNT_0013190453 /DNA_START=196 /DNA_END=1167 /DNA_ORIENTATION=-